MSFFYAGDPDWRKVRIEHNGSFESLRVWDVDTGLLIKGVYHVSITISHACGMVCGKLRCHDGPMQSVSREEVKESVSYTVDEGESVNVVEMVIRPELMKEETVDPEGDRSWLYRWEKVHRSSSNHREHLSISRICGCFHCLKLFSFVEIREWIDEGSTAKCPGCGIDAVLGFMSDAEPVEVLTKMHEKFFGKEEIEPEEGSKSGKEIARRIENHVVLGPPDEKGMVQLGHGFFIHVDALKKALDDWQKESTDRVEFTKEEKG